MSNLFWLTEAQMTRLRSFFPNSHGRPRIDDMRVLSGIIFINRERLVQELSEMDRRDGLRDTVAKLPARLGIVLRCSFPRPAISSYCRLRITAKKPAIIKNDSAE